MEAVEASSAIPADVRGAFDALPEPQRATLLALRDVVLAAAAETEGVGAIVETLKWGEPSYLPTRPRVGTTVRLGMTRNGRPAMFVNCQTTLIGTFRDLYGEAFDFEGNRALVIPEGELPRAALAHCVALALTYHRRKRV